MSSGGHLRGLASIFLDSEAFSHVLLYSPLVQIRFWGALICFSLHSIMKSKKGQNELWRPSKGLGLHFFGLWGLLTCPLIKSIGQNKILRCADIFFPSFNNGVQKRPNMSSGGHYRGLASTFLDSKAFSHVLTANPNVGKMFRGALKKIRIFRRPQK